MTSMPIQEPFFNVIYKIPRIFIP